MNVMAATKPGFTVTMLLLVKLTNYFEIIISGCETPLVHSLKKEEEIWGALQAFFD